MKDPRWQKKRLEILERDKWRCQRCFDKDYTLVVHHKWYHKNTEPWEYDGECYVTLCEDCHTIFHKMFEGQMNSEIYIIYKYWNMNETDIFLFTTHLNRYISETSTVEFLDMAIEFKEKLIDYIDSDN